GADAGERAGAAQAGRAGAAGAGAARGSGARATPGGDRSSRAQRRPTGLHRRRCHGIAGLRIQGRRAMNETSNEATDLDSGDDDARRSAYAVRDVSRLFELPESRLRYWAQT